jgi:signal transduction histidine kinase
MRIINFLTLLVAVTLSASAFCADGGTRDEAKAMAEKAVAHFRDVGAAAAFADFMKPEWRDRDLYVVAIKNDGMMQANGGVPATVGRNNIALRDVDGKLMTQEMLAVKDTAWVEYKWKNPVSNVVEKKATYTIRASDDFIIGVGAFYK